MPLFILIHRRLANCHQKYEPNPHNIFTQLQKTQVSYSENIYYVIRENKENLYALYYFHKNQGYRAANNKQKKDPLLSKQEI